MTTPDLPGDGERPQDPAQQQPQDPAQQQPQQPAQQPQQYQQPHYQQQYAQPQYAQQPQYQQQYAQQPYSQVQYGVPGVGEPFNGAASPEDLARPLYGATFGQSISRFFKNYVNFKGRASRSEYWWSQLFVALMYLVPMLFWFIGIIIMIAAAPSYSNGYSPASTSAENAGGMMIVGAVILFLLIALGTLLPTISIIWRRLHDANFAGPFYFLTFSYIGSIVVLVFMFMPPKPEGRRFDSF